MQGFSEPHSFPRGRNGALALIRAWIAKSRLLRAIAGLWFLALAIRIVVPSLSFAQERRQVTDETGRAVEVPVHPQRIVSLAPNLTETLFALGLDARIVGDTDSCDYPPAARSLPHVGSIIAPNLEKIVSLHPDLILATTAGNRRETVRALERMGFAVYASDPHSVTGTLASIRRIASLVGAGEQGQALLGELRARLQRVAEHIYGHPRPTVLFVVWFEPIITTGRHTFLNDAIESAGGQSISSNLEEDWPRLSLEEVVRRDPDVILTARAPGMEQRLQEIFSQPGWRELKAVRNRRVIVLDDKALRPGPRLVELIEELARGLHPEAFP